MEEFRETELISAATALAQNRQSIVERYKLLSEANNIRQMEQDTFELVEYLDAVNLFPVSAPLLDKKKKCSWLLDEKPQIGIAVAKKCKNYKDLYWVVNYKDKRIYMAPDYDRDIFIDRPAELILEIPEVIDSFLGRITNDFSPENSE